MADPVFLERLDTLRKQDKPVIDKCRLEITHLIEITPASIRLRKRTLDINDRRKAARKKAKLATT